MCDLQISHFSPNFRRKGIRDGRSGGMVLDIDDWCWSLAHGWSIAVGELQVEMNTGTGEY